MTTTIVAPMTQSELTETDINYSIKIGKQVLTQQLEARTEVLYREVNELCNQIPPANKNSKWFLKSIENQFNLTVDNDSDFNVLRTALNLFTDNKLKRNTDLIIDTNIIHICNYLLRPIDVRHCGHTKPLHVSMSSTVENAIKTAKIKIDYFLCTSLPNKDVLKKLKEGDLNIDDRDAISNKYSIEIYLDNEIVSLLKAHLAIFKLVNSKTKEYNSLIERLNNIDKYMQQLEAELLVKELQRSSHGRDVLAATCQMVDGVLGNQSKLLKLE